MRALALVAFLALPARAGNIRIDVFHTNDIHGWMMSRAAYWNEKDPKRMIGGVPALVNAVKKLAKPGDKVLLLDAGDWYQGTPEGSIPKGKAMAELFNAAGFDALEIGNHEFDIGEEGLKALIAQIRVPVLGANIREVATGKRVPYARGHIVKDLGGVKVGIFGLLTTNMRRLTFAKNIAGLEFEDEAAAARREVAALKAEGAQVIVALTHVGLVRPGNAPFEDDVRVAGEVPGIDLIVGGHSHTFLEQPIRDEVHGTLIVQDGQYLSKVGLTTLEYDPAAGKVVSSQDSLRELWVDEFGEDPDTLAIVRRYQQDVGKVLDVVIATATATLTRDRERESSLGDWMTDCQRRWTKTQVGFQNGGGIRADLPAGPVRLRQLFEIMPFDNYLVTTTLTGKQVREVLEQGVSGRIGVLQMSGVAVRYDPKAPMDARVREVRVGGEPLRDDRTYSVTAEDFMVQGGDGYGALGRGEDEALSDTLMRDAMAWCARTRPLIERPAAGRITRE
ncbi:MAG TPA: bifunctional UDP-sugar hydrolase/5'-nucleotidase [Elusimicrobiota bacterium]|jgi:2',3'-cyclic-nucleotide 2'-phosphodiesterase (5'-nucleotidase family)|nr:bifunctional UDP-sugar hydrolase/5'-nucleotidase [Elusimicrobiota bacterium]